MKRNTVAKSVDQKKQEIMERVRIMNEEMEEPLFAGDYIQAAADALAVLTEFDPGLMGKEFSERITKMKEQAFEIVEFYLGEIHEEMIEQKNAGDSTNESPTAS
jgi:hypothetical protein